MKPIYPGQAAITRHNGLVTVVICDLQENLLLGDGSFDLKGELHRVTIQGVTVAALRFVFVLKSGGKVQEYVGWINELEENVVESLGTLQEVTMLFASPEGEQLGEATAPNTLQAVAHFSLPMISELASKAPWTPAHFAGVVAFVEASG